MAATIGRLRNVASVLGLGLRNYWYPVILSSRVDASKPVAVRALGEELAIWRDIAGNVHVFFDACPHRRAQLSLGNVRADRLQCVYHGLEFDGSGQCVQIPWEEPGTPQLRQLAARAYPAADLGGFIWAYFGTAAPPPPLEYELPPELMDRDYVTYFQEETWDVPWPLSLEGSFDPQHNQFLHADSYLQKQLQGRGGNIQSYKMKVVKTETLWAPSGMATSRVPGLRLQRLGSDGSVAADLGGGFTLPATISLVFRFADEPELIINRSYRTPVDENRTQVLRAISRRAVTEEDRAHWHQLYHDVLLPDLVNVSNQDHSIIRSQRGIAFSRDGEHLLQCDVGIAALRRLLLEAYESEQRGERYSPVPVDDPQ